MRAESQQQLPTAWQVLVDSPNETVFIGRSRSRRHDGIGLLMVAFLGGGFMTWQGYSNFAWWGTAGAVLFFLIIASIGISQFKDARVRIVPGKIEIRESRQPWQAHALGAFVLEMIYETGATDIWAWSLKFRPAADDHCVDLGGETENLGNFQETLQQAKFAVTALAERSGFQAIETSVQRERPRADLSGN